MNAIARTIALNCARGTVALIGFILAAVALTLVFAYEVNRSFKTSIASNGTWIVRIDRIETLHDLASALTLPGNDVFSDGDVVSQRARLHRVLADFNAHLDLLRREFENRVYAVFQRQLGRLRQTLDELQREELLRDSAIAARNARRGAVAVLILPAIVLALGLYLRHAKKEELIVAQRHIAALEQSEGQLREAIQERDTRQQKLDEQQHLLLSAARIAHLGVWKWDVAEDRITWSDETYRILGVDRETFAATYAGYLALVHPDDLKTVKRAIRAAFVDQRPYVLTHRIVRPDETVRTLYAEGEIETGLNGQPARLSGIVQDITATEEARAAIRLSEERFQLAVRATNDAIWDWDLTTNSLWVSEIFRSQFGYPEHGGTNVDVWMRAIHPEDKNQVSITLHEAFKGSAFWSHEYRLRAFDGTWREVFNRGFIVRDEKGKAVRVIGAMRDITERNAAARSFAALSREQALILSSAAEGIFGIDLEGRTRFINEAGARMLGWTVDELLGRHMHNAVHHTRESGEPYPWEECLCHATLVGGVFRSQDADTFWKRDGTPVPIACTSSPMLDENGEVVGAVGTFRDVTSRLAVDRMKNEFISTVSHELRTPLTSIRGAIGLLASGRVGALSEKAQKLADIASTNTDRLVRLINDILDIERIESGEVAFLPRSCLAADLIRQSVDVVRSLADHDQIKIETESEPIALLADPDRIVQTLTNLISNAVKFSPAGSTIRVAAKQQEDSVLFTVSDEGRGVPPDKLSSIFERFQQVDASDSRDKGGSGLGLAICKSIVEQHGGAIGAESTLGTGSVFSFTIPNPQADTSLPGGDRPPRVLLCDDDEDTRRLIATILTGHGYCVREAPSGQDLLAAANEEKPDVILLDLFMPDLNGWEALARLRNDPATAAIPVVIVSVLSPDDVGLPFTSLSGWVQKPLEPGTLLSAIANAFNSSARRPQIVLIEDDLDLARVIATSFERYGIDMFHAANGAAAIELATRIEPDLVVLDLVLPDIDGFKAVDWLKRHDRWRSVPLVVYSALEPTRAEQARLILGRTEFFTKSRISPEAFEQRIVLLLDKLIGSSKGALVHAA